MSTAQWLEVLRKRPWLVPGSAYLAVDSIARRLTAPRYTALSNGSDPEQQIYPLRFSQALPLLRQGKIEAAVLELENVAVQSSLPDDAYSCAQRLSNAFIVARLFGLPLPAIVQARLHQDATRLAAIPEFRHRTVWFNNHLLNDLRGLLLYEQAFVEGPCPPRISAASKRVERILLRHLTTLFRDGEGPVLNEGSVSYEILVLARIFDIAMAAPDRPLAQLFAHWLRERARAAAAIFLKDGEWLLPEIGDVTPDWSSLEAKDFLDGVFLGRDTMYRRCWDKSLESLGFPIQPTNRLIEKDE